MLTIGPTNVELAEALEQMADVLVRQGRVQPVPRPGLSAGRRDDPRPGRARRPLYGDGGREALTSLPGIGVSLAHHIAQYVETGRIGLRDRLLRSTDPIALLSTVPGIVSALRGQAGE